MTRHTSTRPRHLSIENLECRALMSGVALSGGWLDIDGTNGNDTVVVADPSPGNPVGIVSVVFNGQGFGFSKQIFPLGIKFHGFGGHDYFSTNMVRQVHAWGGSGNDTLIGGSANDKLYGENGNDDIQGNGGKDSIYGGNHNDTIDGGTGDDWIAGQAGSDSILGGDGHDTMYGYTGNDTLRGGDGNDIMSGWDGADRLYGDAGNDKMWGHDDDDSMYGSTGNDTMDGGSGEDYLSGGDHNDRMLGGGWNDEMHGNDGNDWMTGQSGHDSLFGDEGHDTMYGYTGNDLLVGDDGNDVMSGWDGNDLLYGREGNDKLWGHDGRDGLMGGNGTDTVNGGGNSDRYLTIGDHSEIVSMSGGDATIQFGGPQLWSYAEIERLDKGLARLHHRTGNTVLLKDPEENYNPAQPKNPLLFIERDGVSPDGYDGENNGGTITMYDEAFASSDNWVEHVIVHEVAHNWDTSGENGYSLSGEDVVDYFRSLSDWRNDLGSGDTGDTTNFGGQTYVKASSGNWWYLQSASFPSDYAQKSPTEDFCETVAACIMGSDFVGGTPFAPVAKRAWINGWLNNV